LLSRTTQDTVEKAHPQQPPLTWAAT